MYKEREREKEEAENTGEDRLDNSRIRVEDRRVDRLLVQSIVSSHVQMFEASQGVIGQSARRVRCGQGKNSPLLELLLGLEIESYASSSVGVEESGERGRTVILGDDAFFHHVVRLLTIRMGEQTVTGSCQQRRIRDVR